MNDRAHVIGDLHHVTVAVSDLDAALLFYRDALGLRVVGNFEFDDEGHQVYMGLPVGGKGRAAALRTARPPAAGITLVEFDPGPTHGVPPLSTQPGGCMLAFELASAAEVDAIHERLGAAGYDSVSEPLWADVGGWGRVRAIAVRDPDGFLIEFYAAEETTQ